MSDKHSGIWDSVKGIVAKVAPTVGTALGGPFGGIAGTLIQQALGVNSDDAAVEALKTNPDALLKLKQAEIDFKKFMADGKIKLVDLEVQDRASARQLAIAKGMVPQVALASLYTVGYFALMVGLMMGYLHVPQDGHDLLLGLTGALSAGEVQILNFFFGSSSGSKEKTQLLGQ